MLPPQPVEVLKLSRADFETGFMFELPREFHLEEQYVPLAKEQPGEADAKVQAAGGHEAAGPAKTMRSLGTPYTAPEEFKGQKAVAAYTEDDLRRRLLGFIRMVSRKELLNLKLGEILFKAGDVSESPHPRARLQQGRGAGPGIFPGTPPPRARSREGDPGTNPDDTAGGDSS